MMLTRLQRFAANPSQQAQKLKLISGAVAAAPVQNTNSQSQQAAPFSTAQQKRTLTQKSKGFVQASHRAFTSTAEDKEGSENQPVAEQKPAEQEVAAEETQATAPVEESAPQESSAPTNAQSVESEQATDELTLEDLGPSKARNTTDSALFGQGPKHDKNNRGRPPRKQKSETNQLNEQLQDMSVQKSIHIKEMQLLKAKYQNFGGGLADASIQDLEGAISHETNFNRINILKQVVTDPDYQAREKFLGHAAPQSLQEEKQQTLQKLAAYNKSADILKLIKTRMGKDESLKHYLVNELEKSGSEVAGFMAEDLKSGERSLKETKTNSTEYAQMKEQQATDKLRQTLEAPFDSISIGTQGKYGHKAFTPANERDRFARHEKNSIASFEQYQEYLHKIGLDKAVLERNKLVSQQDKLFTRYNIKEEDREFYLPLEITRDDPNYELKVHKIQLLASEIPEFRLMIAEPTLDDYVTKELQKTLLEEMHKIRQIDEARAPQVAKQLAAFKPKFESENSDLSQKDRDQEWQRISDAAYSKTKTDLPEQVKKAIESTQGRLSAIEEIMPSKDMSAAELMADQRYQQINDAGTGPLSIDRATRDGPRDLIGDAQNLIKSGPFFDLSKTPGTSKERGLKAEENVMAAMNAYTAETNPSQYFLNNVSQLRHHLEENYDYAKKVENAIDVQRQGIAGEIIQMQGRLEGIKSKKDSLQQLIQETHASTMEQQVLPDQKLYDFTAFAKSQQEADRVMLLNQELASLLEKRAVFDPESTDPQTYEQELRVLSQHALLNQALGKQNDQLDHFSYVLGQHSANRVASTTQIDARCFEYAVLNEKSQIANDLLQKLTKDRNESLSPIDPTYLQSFFAQSLKRGNLDGIAYLVNYSARYGIDTSSYPINNFRGALDHHLNRNFDLSKVMTFLKFYQKHFADKARKEFNNVEATSKDLPESTLLALSKSIFGQSDGLVDMPALVDHLVDQVGTRQVLDPFTREDSLWQLIESQTLDKDYVRAASMSQYNKIEGKTVARYLSNQFARTTSFDRTFRTALRVQGTPMADAFFSEIMQQLNKYTLANGNQLPGSFTESKLSDLYLRLKLSEAELSPATSELLLFALNKKGMHKEIIDLCSDKQSDIHKYYLAESLLQGKVSNKSYAEALNGSNAFSDKDLSACQLTQKAKALFLDGSDQGAIDFFRAELAKRESRAKERKELMVSMYDNVMSTSTSADKKLTFQQFKDKHQETALFSKRLIQQTFAVSTLSKIVKSNDYDGIDSAFNLYTLMKQERDLTGVKFIVDSNTEQVLTNIKNLTHAESAQLEAIQARKSQLLQKVNGEDYNRLKELVEITAGQSLGEVADLDPKGLDRLINMFHDMTFGEANQYMAAAQVGLQEPAPEKKTSGKKKGGKASKKDSQEAVTKSTMKQSKSLADVLQAIQDQKESSKTDWFQEFITLKKQKLDQSISDVLERNTTNAERERLGQAPKLKPWEDPQKVNRGKKQNNQTVSKGQLMEDLKFNPELKKQIEQSSGGIDEYIKEMTQTKHDDDYQEDEFAQLIEEDFGIKDPDFSLWDDVEDSIERICEAYDSDKEKELDTKWQLFAKQQVLADELAKDRFSQPRGKLSKELKDQMHDYAKSMAMYRLEIADLQKSLSKLNLQERQFESPEHETLYESLYRPVKSQAMQAKGRLNADQATDGSDVLNSIKGVNTSTSQIDLVDLDFSASNAFDLDSRVLPDTEACQKIESEAVKEAEAEFKKYSNAKNKATKQEDVIANTGTNEYIEGGVDAEFDAFSGSKSSKKGFLSAAKATSPQSTTSSDKDVTSESKQHLGYEGELSRAEQQISDQCYDYFFFGQERRTDGKFTHPREILRELQNDDSEDPAINNAVAERIIEGLDLPHRDIDEGETESDVEEEGDDEKHVRNLKEDDMADYILSKMNALVLRNPLDSFERMDIRNNLDYVRNRRVTDMYSEVDSGEKYERYQLDTYNKHMLEDDLDADDNYDPLNYHRHSHDLSIIELKECLTKAVTDRKAQALPLAIQIFNRIQEKQVSTTKLEDKLSDEIDSITESLDRADILLNDKSSPLISNLRALSKYATQKLPETIDGYRAQVKNGDIINQPVDLNVMINDYRALNKTEEQLSKMNDQLSSVEARMVEQESSVKSLAEKREYDAWVKSSQEQTQQMHEEYLKKMYDEYLAQGDDVSDEGKVRLMRDAFRIQLGESFINTETAKSDSSFPAFYALDMIQFGLKREIPAAIRLGELLLAENCPSDTKMPAELARAVKDYMFDHQEQYQAAAKYTGPINATHIYHQSNQQGVYSENEQPVVVTMDDPYWRDFQAKNYRREDNWRLPSIHAWDHKPMGILGEILDFKQLEKNLRESQMKM